MPTYDYKCNSCGSTQEEVHSINSKLEVKCKQCGSFCEKQFSPNKYFVLKGNDWPSQGFRIKKQMTEKNAKMKSKMNDREKSGEGVTKLKDIK